MVTHPGRPRNGPTHRTGRASELPELPRLPVVHSLCPSEQPATNRSTRTSQTFLPPSRTRGVLYVPRSLRSDGRGAGDRFRTEQLINLDISDFEEPSEVTSAESNTESNGKNGYS